MDTCEIGRFGEDIAAAYLEARGYEVVDRNVRACGGEVDLVATVGAGGAAGALRGTAPGTWCSSRSSTARPTRWGSVRRR